MSHRPLTPDGARPRRPDEMSDGERAQLRRQNERAAHLKRNPHLTRDPKFRRDRD